MINRFNYTGRRRIPRSRVGISIADHGGAAPVFECDVNLDGFDYPDAKVYVEAYRRASFMRFPFGTVSSRSIPTDRSLTDIDTGDLFYFRVKIVDETTDIGTILAQADNIEVSRPDREMNSLLPVEGSDLGQLLWKVEFGDERPILQVNDSIPDIIERVETDPEFQSLILPAVFERVLWQIVIDKEDAEDEDRWAYPWGQFASRLKGDPFPNKSQYEVDPNVAQPWIDECVEKFALKHQFTDRFIEAINAGQTT